MGCASSAQPQPPSHQQDGNNGGGGGRNVVQTVPADEIGNSVPLQEPQRWSSKRKITRQQLEAKRAEFWHTCQATNVPAVWQQIKTVCEVMAGGDLATASAICQAANIITPEGSLTRCYDQFGNLVSSNVLSFFTLFVSIYIFTSIKSNTKTTFRFNYC